MSVETGNSLGDDIQWGAGQDSFYEVNFNLHVSLIVVFDKSICFMAEFEDRVISRSVDIGSRKHHAKSIELELGNPISTFVSVPCHARPSKEE